MRPPKPRGGVQGGPDPSQPPYKLPSNLTPEVRDLLAELTRRTKSNQTLPGTSSQVGVLLGTRDDPGVGESLDGFQVRQPAETQKTADALNSRRSPGIEDMRPPKPRGGVQGDPDPPQPPYYLPSTLTHEVQDLLAELTRRTKFNRTLPVTSSQLGVILGPRDDPGLGKSLDGFQFRQPAETQKTADALDSRHSPGIEDRNKRYHQGSSSAPNLIMKDCRICMQSKPLSKFFFIKGCTHSYCSRCLRAYIKTKVNMKATLIKCPDPACKDSELEPLACKLIITKEVFDRWCDVLSESSVKVKFYCPFKDCSALLIDERGQEVMQESECPHCHRLFCAHCGVPWHSGLSCSEFLEMDNQEDKTLIKLAQKNKWQRCPKCKFYVERTSGCMFIQCSFLAFITDLCLWRFGGEMEEIGNSICKIKACRNLP